MLMSGVTIETTLSEVSPHKAAGGAFCEMTAVYSPVILETTESMRKRSCAVGPSKNCQRWPATVSVKYGRASTSMAGVVVLDTSHLMRWWPLLSDQKIRSKYGYSVRRSPGDVRRLDGTSSGLFDVDD